MSTDAAPLAGANPFSTRTALALVLFGSLVFVALLWMIGSGLGTGDANDGGAHAEGRGLNGYSAFAKLLEQGGRTVRRSRSKRAFGEPGLLILTPPLQAKGRDIDQAVSRHRRLGPTLVITPKWSTAHTSLQDTSAKRGWVRLIGATGPNWPGFLDQVTVDVKNGDVKNGDAGQRGRWRTRTLAGSFPDPRRVMSGAGAGLVPLVTGERGEIYAAYLDDGSYPGLAAMAPGGMSDEDEDDEGGLYPLLIVFDPDLLDNYGMAKLPSAQLASALVNATAGKDDPITFDLTLNGLERNASLLSLAFTPPFLAATLCLLLAAGTVGWRAFLRFGPPHAPGRAIAFGKRALVANSAGLIVRSRRFHLLGRPYAEAARKRLARAFALPRNRDAATELTALDQAAQSSGAGPHAFSQATARLEQARNERDLVKAAAELHALERTLTR